MNLKQWLNRLELSGARFVVMALVVSLCGCGTLAKPNYIQGIVKSDSVAKLRLVGTTAVDGVTLSPIRIRQFVRVDADANFGLMATFPGPESAYREDMPSPPQTRNQWYSEHIVEAGHPFTILTFVIAGLVIYQKCFQFTPEKSGQYEVTADLNRISVTELRSADNQFQRIPVSIKYFKTMRGGEATFTSPRNLCVVGEPL